MYMLSPGRNDHQLPSMVTNADQLQEPLFPELEPRYLSRVYFGLGQNGQVKIGITSRVDGRRGGEMHFTELCAVEGDRRVEDSYHQRYALERIGRTEWFYLSDKLLIDLITMCVTQGRSASVEVLKGLTLNRLQRAG